MPYTGSLGQRVKNVAAVVEASTLYSIGDRGRVARLLPTIPRIGKNGKGVKTPALSLPAPAETKDGAPHFDFRFWI